MWKREMARPQPSIAKIEMFFKPQGITPRNPASFFQNPSLRVMPLHPVSG
jgi:hypothetical protein